MNTNLVLTRDVLTEKAPFLVKYSYDNLYYFVRSFLKSEINESFLNEKFYYNNFYKVSNVCGYSGSLYYSLEKKECQIILKNGRKIYSVDENLI